MAGNLRSTGTGKSPSREHNINRNLKDECELAEGNLQGGEEIAF